jgi:hypothetical protein
VTRTVDDEFGDPATSSKIIFTNQWSQGRDCTGCEAKLDKGNVLNGTWHDTTGAVDGRGPSDAIFEFTGKTVSRS